VVHDQTKVVEQRYKELGGQITVVIKRERCALSPASADQSRVIDLIVAKTSNRI